MVWQIFALITALSRGFQKVIHRSIMKKENYVAYGWFFNLLTGILFLFLFVRGITIPSSSYAWILALFAGFLWAVIALIGFKSYQYTQVSLREPLARTDVLFLLLFSVLILQESVTIPKLAGVLLIFVGLIILTWHKRRIFGKLSDLGVQLTLLVAVFDGFVAVVDKTAIVYFLPVFYGFLMYFLPAIYLTPLALKNIDKVKELLSNKALAVVVACILGVIAYYFQLSAYMLAEVSNVFPVIQLSTLITALGGVYLYKEEELDLRLLGAIFMIVGSSIILKPEILLTLLE